MLTDKERIKILEDAIEEFHSAMQAAGAFTINSIAAVLDQLVDERKMQASTRKEIWKRVESEVGTIRSANRWFEYGARGALPSNRYSVGDSSQRPAPRVRKETLSPRSIQRETDHALGQQQFQPEPPKPEG